MALHFKSAVANKRSRSMHFPFMTIVWLVVGILRCCSAFSVPAIGSMALRHPQGLTASYAKAVDSHCSVDESTSGPSGSLVHTLTIHTLPGDQVSPEEALPIVIQTGKIGRQASGAVTLTRGDTMLYATACRDEEPSAYLGFVPLTIAHQERFSSAGLTSGGYSKRDGRPAEHEVLTCRLIDRPLRPLIHPGWRHETQVLSWVLSYDALRSCDPLAITASAAALYLSDVPLKKPVAAVMVGYHAQSDRFLLNPTHEELESSSLNLIVAGSKDAVLMIEGGANFLPEEILVRAVGFAHDAIQAICHGVELLGSTMGIKRKTDTILGEPIGLQKVVDELLSYRVDRMYEAGGSKEAQRHMVKSLQKELKRSELCAKFSENEVSAAFKDLLSRRMYKRAHETGKRSDGRELDEIRGLDMEAGILPRAHGSAIFTRGETQVLATVTLGDATMRQAVDTLDGVEKKRFYLQYTFPPSCVGETDRVGAPGRREIGHGSLAERALSPALHDETVFPHTVRMESLVTESHGSSSMASVCGGTLALLDAGVRIKKAVAGIAMGLLTRDNGGDTTDESVILSDITGTEDALGAMDFKVAGDRKGVTAFQLDVKCEGLSLKTLERALEQARVGRLHILDAMEEVLSEPRQSLGGGAVPQVATMQIKLNAVGKVIGTGGKTIRSIMEKFDLKDMNVDRNSGTVRLSSLSSDKLEGAMRYVTEMIDQSEPAARSETAGESRPRYAGPEPVEGKIYRGKITGVQPYGIFVEFMPGSTDGSTPGLEALCHISELSNERIHNCGDFVRSLETDEIDVAYLGINKIGKRVLSRKAVEATKQ